MERFRPLHLLALQLLERLTAEFDVVRTERLGLDAALEQPGVALPTVQLVPRSEDGAPLVVAFTALPGLHVRFGRWHTQPFPACGCDTCAETLEQERDRFLWRVLQVVEGRYREASSPLDRDTLVLQHEFWSPDGVRAGGAARITAVAADALALGAVFEWQPWLRLWGAAPER